ncbi:MAG: pyridoxal phosphate-dependent aminotransferase [Anaerolineaceae bacterium]|nr:pyridoxal phosphate-dependent aminotransferase [Anaerolineaceae bacterium]
MATQDQLTRAALDTPEFVVPSANRIPVNGYPGNMMTIPPSRMFLIKDGLKKYKATAGADAPTYDASQGDGGASLPGVPVEILQRALELQIEHGTGYDQPWGTPLFRKVAAEQYWGLQEASGWGPENIVFVQGGRDGLQKAYAAMIAQGHQEVGDALVVSRVPWISYNWGPYAVGLNVLLAPGQPEESWRYTPEGIRACVDYAAQEGRKIAGIVITSPDNPTGRTIPLDEQILLARTALESGIAYVLFDWVYHWVTDGAPSDINVVLQAFEPEQRERLIFLDGITKSLGASNIRSAHLLAGKGIVKSITTQASHGVIPTFYAQAVAIAAYEQGFGKAAASIIGPTKQSRQVLRGILTKAGANFIMGDGYYAFIDCTPYIEASSYQDTEDLSAYLAEQYGIAIVAGAFFSPAGANWVRFSYALPPERTEAAANRLFEALNALL